MVVPPPMYRGQGYRDPSARLHGPDSIHKLLQSLVPVEAQAPSTVLKAPATSLLSILVLRSVDTEATLFGAVRRIHETCASGLRSETDTKTSLYWQRRGKRRVAHGKSYLK
jgi:hypothetical protein